MCIDLRKTLDYNYTTSSHSPFLHHLLIVDCNLEGLFVTDEDPLYLQQIQQFQVQLQKGLIDLSIQDYFQIPFLTIIYQI